MELKSIFIRFRIPEQIIYLGEGETDLFIVKKGVPRKIGSYMKSSQVKVFPDELKRDLINVDTGIILNSGHFVFNLLNFEKIPFMKKQKDELVNWRVRKVFPENINNYHHRFFQFDKNTILSVLIKNDLKLSLENEMIKLNLNLTYFGSSIVEIINSLSVGGTFPDFIIETDGKLMLTIFFKNKIPVYIRKMMIGSEISPENEINKTIGFVRNNYGFSPKYFSIFSSDDNFSELKKRITGDGLSFMPRNHSDRRFLPGVK